MNIVANWGTLLLFPGDPLTQTVQQEGSDLSAYTGTLKVYADTELIETYTADGDGDSITFNLTSADTQGWADDGASHYILRIASPLDGSTLVGPIVFIPEPYGCDYADLGDLGHALWPDDLPLDASRLLREAQDDIDSLLVGAYYEVDANGLPTDVDQLQALTRATCEQVRYLIELGDTTGVQAQATSVTVGSVSVSHSKEIRAVSKRAVKILQNASLLNRIIYSY